jgi:hypothetical protein
MIAQIKKITLLLTERRGGVGDIPWYCSGSRIKIWTQRRSGFVLFHGSFIHMSELYLNLGHCSFLERYFQFTVHKSFDTV